MKTLNVQSSQLLGDDKSAVCLTNGPGALYPQSGQWFDHVNTPCREQKEAHYYNQQIDEEIFNPG
jgi:hypothetical protein